MEDLCPNSLQEWGFSICSYPYNFRYGKNMKFSKSFPKQQKFNFHSSFLFKWLEYEKYFIRTFSKSTIRALPISSVGLIYITALSKRQLALLFEEGNDGQTLGSLIFITKLILTLRREWWWWVVIYWLIFIYFNTNFPSPLLSLAENALTSFPISLLTNNNFKKTPPYPFPFKRG